MSKIRPLGIVSRSTPAVVVALGVEASSSHPSLAELLSLLEGLDFAVAEIVRQRRPPESALGLGSGKVEEVARVCAEIESRLGISPAVVVLGELEPGRLSALSVRLGRVVLDRTEVILRVFERRAETPLAHVEIELARLGHLLPRVREGGVRDDREGGGGRGGRGHSNVVLTKQSIQKRMAELRGRLRTLRQEVDRRIFERTGTARVALVGYTNAGKSSWMRALTGANVPTKDELFHTLGTRVRVLARNPGSKILVADTVGFLEGLPHALLQAFHSTLREAMAADLWVHVADASSPHVERQIEATRRTLREVGEEVRPTLLLLNKADVLTASRKLELRGRYPNALLVSSVSEDDRHEVASHLRAFVEDEVLSTSSRTTLAGTRGPRDFR